jgi:hypothetical protein
MPSKPPQRWKAREHYDPADALREIQAHRRGQEFRAETDEYREYKRDALAAAGLDDDDAPTAKPIADWQPQDHLEDLRRR